MWEQTEACRRVQNGKVSGISHFSQPMTSPAWLHGAREGTKLLAQRRGAHSQQNSSPASAGVWSLDQLPGAVHMGRAQSLGTCTFCDGSGPGGDAPLLHGEITAFCGGRCTRYLNSLVNVDWNKGGQHLCFHELRRNNQDVWRIVPQ